MVCLPLPADRPDTDKSTLVLPCTTGGKNVRETDDLKLLPLQRWGLTLWCFPGREQAL